MQFESYPFEKLNTLLADSKPNSAYPAISLTIGEPQFETPAFIQEAFSNASSLLQKYPKTAGESYLKEAMQTFMQKRFNVTLSNEELIPCFGTREVLFNFPQFLLFDTKEPTMAFTNPFYQIYEGAAIASRAKIVHIELTKENNFKAIPDEQVLKTCDLVIINFPNNPTSASLSLEELSVWVELALKHDFVLLNDECYSEIYFDKKPPSLLQASQAVGNTDFKNVLVINSISKRSSAPGLRSGFIAGDKEILKAYAKYRTYVGCASPLPLQRAAAVAWEKEEHVASAREIYKQNFALAQEILGITPPDATFYIWLKVDDELAFTKGLYEKYNVKVLPGSFLGREGAGEGYVRLALVYEASITKDALEKISKYLKENV